MTVQSIALFSTPVHSTMLEPSLFKQHREALIDRACALTHPTQQLVRASNQGPARHSARDFDVHLIRDVATAWLMGAIRAFTAVALRTELSHISIESCWAVAAPAGGFMTPHTHFPARWAGVVYLDAERFCDPMSPDRAGKIELFNPVPLAEAFGQPGGAVIAPMDGMVLLFPGSLSHMVHPHNADGVRVSVSFNVEVGS